LRVLRRPALIVLATAALAACGGDSPEPAATVAASSSTDRQLTAAATGYGTYVRAQARELRERTDRFAAAVKAGDVAAAKRLFAPARAPWETIEPVAESFGTLDPEIDARVNDVAKGEQWTGFHRIEQALWRDGSTRGMRPVADELVADVARLQRSVQDETYEPEQLAGGASELLDEVSASKITGEEDRYSHTDLWDFEANVAGSRTAFGLLEPALRVRDRALASTIARRFDAVERQLRATKTGGSFPSYDRVGPAERRRLSQAVDALAEPLSQVAGALRN
jgi:iron uptake system component EfeO